MKKLTPKQLNAAIEKIKPSIEEDQAIGTISHREMICLMAGYIWAEADHYVMDEDSTFWDRFNGYLRDNKERYPGLIDSNVLTYEEWADRHER